MKALIAGSSALLVLSLAHVTLAQVISPTQTEDAPPAAPAAPEAEKATEAPPQTPPPATPPAPASPQPRAPAAYPWMVAPPAANAPPVADREPEPDEPMPPAGPPGGQAWIGAKTSFFTGTGFDPFATNDAFTQGSLGFSRRVYGAAPISIAGAISFDFGTKRADARGEPTALESYRLLAGPEGRYHVLPSLYAFVRPSAGVQRTIASLDEGSTGTTLHAREWSFALDASAGVAWSFLDLRSKSTDLMFWLVGDGGYGFTTATDLRLEPDAGSGAPERTAAVDLGELSLSGLYFRVSAAGTF